MSNNNASVRPKKRKHQNDEEKEKMVKFQLSCCFDSDEFNALSFDDMLFFPALFKTVHNNVGFSWKILIKPKGGICDGKDYPDHIGIFMMKKGKGLRSDLYAKPTYFAQSDMHCKLMKTAVITKYATTGCPTFMGCPTFLPKDIAQLKKGSLISDDGCLKVGMNIQIPEKMFDWKEIMEEAEKEAVDTSPLNFGDLFQYVHDSKTPEENLPEKSQRKFLDFTIKTCDDVEMYCHGVVLRNKSEYFKTLFESEMKESEENRVEVAWNAETMMELLHFIYKCSVSESFPDFKDIFGVLDGANMYHLIALKFICERRMIQELDKESCAESLILANRYDLKILREMALNLVSENAAEVWESGKRREMSEELWQEVLEVTGMRMRVAKFVDLA